MSYLQAFVIAVVQGVTELFPISSLGHSVLVPAWIGGSWHTLVTQSSEAGSQPSFYLAYIVALHCATAWPSCGTSGPTGCASSAASCAASPVASASGASRSRAATSAWPG